MAVVCVLGRKIAGSFNYLKNHLSGSQETKMGGGQFNFLSGFAQNPWLG